MTLPPAADLDAEPIAERFFSEGDLVAAHGQGEEAREGEEAWDHGHHKVQRASLPHVVERRQRLARYVRWAVAGAAVVCLAAVARTAMMPRQATAAAAPLAALAASPSLPSVEALHPVAAAAPTVDPSPAAAAPPSVETPKAAEVLPSAEVPPVAETPKAAEVLPVAETPKAAEVLPVAETRPVAQVPPVAEPAKAAKAPKADDAKAATAAAAPAPAPPDGKTALQEKNEARRNLERGKIAASIEAGERSVALDPQDGEAWLLLGAAYQEQGKNAEARRCYTACLNQGKRGPLGECRAMIR